MKKINFFEIGRLSIWCFLIPLLGLTAFTHSTIIGSTPLYLVISLCLLWGSVSSIKLPYVDKGIVIFLSFYMLPFLVGLFSYPVSFFYESDKFDYNQLDFSGRVFNLLLFFTLIVVVHTYVKFRDELLLFRWYNLGILILLFTAVWHALSIYTNFISWPFETRSNLHSTYGVDYSFGSRVTGLAREPSFFVMYVVDFVALSIILYTGIKRSLLITMACFVMILSLSPSGYIVLILTFILSYIFSFINIKQVKGLVKISVSIITVFCFLIYVGTSENPFLEYITNRVLNADANNSGRLFMLLGPFEWIQESNYFSLLFGHGMKSYSIIGTHYFLPNSDPVHVTSNNMYIDLLWESGVIGLLIMISFLLYIFYKAITLKVTSASRFAIMFVYFDLLLSSLFRADYTSLRFFIILYLLFVLIYVVKHKEKSLQE